MGLICPPKTFCALGRFVPRTFCPLERFVPWDVLSVGRFVLGLLSWDVLYVFDSFATFSTNFKI